MKIGETTFENGLEKLDFKHPLLLKNLDFDKLYHINGPTKAESFSLRNFVLLPENTIKSEVDIISEIELHEHLQKISKKPNLFPTYRGYIKNKEDMPQMTTYSLIFESFEKPLEALIQDKRQTDDYFSFNTIQYYFKSLVNGLAFMQVLDLFPIDLTPENIFLTSDNVLKFISFTDQNFYLRNYKIKKTGFNAPEVLMPQKATLWNYYKSEVFTLGVIILYLGTFSIPRADHMEEDVARLIEEFIKFYYERARDEEEKKKVKEFKDVLNEILGPENIKRPDFINLFYRMIDLKNKETLQKHILIEDGIVF